MRVSVLVPAFNEAKIIAKSLAAMKQACRAFERRGWAWELIVCDNNSSDQTADLARAAGASVVFEPVNQISRARNRAAAGASGDWLIFVDADSFPGERLFARVAEEITSARCVGGGCLMRLDEERLLAGSIVHLWNGISRLLKWAAGSFIFCEAKIFRELGGFSTELYASEEIDFSRRLKAAARRQKRQVVIITDEMLVTSARKMHLYGKREHLRFMLKAALFPRRVCGRREECVLWYDGRR